MPHATMQPAAMQGQGMLDSWQTGKFAVSTPRCAVTHRTGSQRLGAKTSGICDLARLPTPEWNLRYKIHDDDESYFVCTGCVHMKDKLHPQKTKTRVT
jgi:hypothetical protein